MGKSLDPRESAASHAPVEQVDFYTQALKASEEFREGYKGRLNVVKSSQMPFERSPDGLIKHIINEEMDTKECCIDIYMQFLPPAKLAASTAICRRKSSTWSKGTATICIGTSASTARTSSNGP